MPFFRFESDSIKLRVLSLVFTALCLYLLSAASASGQDVNAMFKQFNKEHRLVQKNMFAGKSDQAIAGLEKLRDLLDQIKAADPKNSKLKTAERKYTKLVKDLERKTGRDLGGGSATAANSKATNLPPKPETKPLTVKQPAPKALSRAKQPNSRPPSTATKADKLPSGVTSRIKKRPRNWFRPRFRALKSFVRR